MRVTKDQSLLTVAATAIRTLPTLAVVLSLPSLMAAAPAKAPQKISYNRDIRPVLSDNCFFCHGPDQKKRKAKLRLDIREEVLAKEAFVPGAPDKSELIRRIFTTDTDDLMPPPASRTGRSATWCRMPLPAPGCRRSRSRLGSAPCGASARRA